MVGTIKMKEEINKNGRRYYLLITTKRKKRTIAEYVYGSIKELYQKASQLQRQGYLFI